MGNRLNRKLLKCVSVLTVNNCIICVSYYFVILKTPRAETNTYLQATVTNRQQFYFHDIKASTI